MNLLLSKPETKDMFLDQMKLSDEEIELVSDCFERYNIVHVLDDIANLPATAELLYFTEARKFELYLYNNQLFVIEKTELTEDVKELTQFDQEFTSKETAHGNGSANGGSGRVPALFKSPVVNYHSGDILLDYGCGEESTGLRIQEFLDSKGVTYVGYDKYNRTKEQNDAALKTVFDNNGADIVTCANVLNVIKERNIRVNEVIRNIFDLLKTSGYAYFDVYSVKGKEPTQTGKDKYQLFKPLDEYLEEVAEVFGNSNVVRRGSVIIACK